MNADRPEKFAAHRSRGLWKNDPMVLELNDCRLRTVNGRWPFEVRHAKAIAAHWKTAASNNPKLFNGRVFVLRNWSIEHDVLFGEAMPTAFAAYLYWRDTGFDGGDTAEAFASSIIVAADGGVLVAKAAAGTLNEEQYVSPGGLLDQRDVTEDGLIDIAGAAAREIAEEVGLGRLDLTRQPGFRMAMVEPYLALASMLHSPLSGAALVRRVADFLSNQAEPELEAPRIVRSRAELDDINPTRFTRLLSETVLA